MKAFPCGSEFVVNLCLRAGTGTVRSQTMNLPHSLFDRPSKSLSLSLGNSTMRMTNIPVTACTVSSVCLDAARPAWWRWRQHKD